MRRRTFLGAAAVAGLAAPWVRRAGAADPVTLRVHHFLPTSSATHAFITAWARELETDTAGALRATVHGAMELGGRPPQLYDQARNGVVDAVWTLPGYTPGRFPRSEVFELPFVAAPSAETNSRAVQAFADKHLGAEFGDVRLLMLHAHAAGSFHLRRRPVARLEDLAGARVRAPSRVVNDTLAALGAVPVGMPVPQVPEALSRGVIDGALLPYEVTRSLRVHELTDSNTELRGDRGLYTAVFLFAMNKDRYEGLPAELRAAIDRASGTGLARRTGRLWDEAEAAGRKAAEEAGHRFDTVSGTELERWRAAAAPVTAAWIKAMGEAGHDGAALLADAEALIAANLGG